MIKTPIYLDYCATTPCDPQVVQKMLPYFTDYFGNAASRDHIYGWQAKDAVEQAREQIARLIGASSNQIVFTSGATESINLALKGVAEAKGMRGKHIITTKAEHKAVLDTCRYLEQKGVAVSYLEVDNDGQIGLDALEKAIRRETVCIAIMWANNETGIINPVKKIGEIARKYNLYFMCDATQAIGKIPIDVDECHIDLMAFSAHKLYGPKGVGALFVRGREPKVDLWQQQHGGNHERGKRSGTLNTPGIVGFGEAANICYEKMSAEGERLQKWRNQLEKNIIADIRGAHINGRGERLPHVTNIFFPEIEGEQLLLAISRHLALSRGSACSGLVQQPSHVLLAMGLSALEAQQSLRISIGRFTEEKDIEVSFGILSDTLRKLWLTKQTSISY